MDFNLEITADNGTKRRANSAVRVFTLVQTSIITKLYQSALYYNKGFL